MYRQHIQFREKVLPFEWCKITEDVTEIAKHAVKWHFFSLPYFETTVVLNYFECYDLKKKLQQENPKCS